MASGATAKYGIPVPISTDPNNIPGDVLALANAFEALIAVAIQGVLANRPAPGKFGRIYAATDIGTLFFDTGSAWASLGSINLLSANITVSLPGDAVAAGGTGTAADAAHRHGRETSVLDGSGNLSPLRTYAETLLTIGASGANASLDLSAAREFAITLTASPVTIAFANAPSTPNVRLAFAVAVSQDGAGARTVNWPASVSWGAAGAPTLSTVGGRTDIVGFLSDNGGATWRGLLGGIGF